MNSNDPDIQYELALIYYEGILIEKNIEKAFNLLNISSNNGNLNSKQKLEELTLNNTQKNIEENLIQKKIILEENLKSKNIIIPQGNSKKKIFNIPSKQNFQKKRSHSNAIEDNHK